MRISAKNKICMIIGDPVEHSLSPKMHNATYKALGIDDKFVFVGARVSINDIEEVVKGVRAMNIRGLTCTIPHKLKIIKYLDWIDPIAKEIGAVNTVVNENGFLKGYNTDYLGVAVPIDKLTSISNASYAIIGAGGAARAVAYIPYREGANMKIFNRTLANAKKLAKEFNCEYATIEEIKSLDNFDVIINATPVGMRNLKDKTPINTELIQKKHIVFDVVYVPYETKLLKDAKKKGAKIIHGIDMLLYQGTAQFHLYTGYKAPEDVMRKSLLEHFGIKIESDHNV